jgi:hypothetical protein
MNRTDQRAQSVAKSLADSAAAENSGLIAPRNESQRNAPARSREGRLDSWKEIAHYLGRDVRTVQRWEKSERLPVHRHIHRKNGSVYAFKSELDVWRDSRTLLAASRLTPESTAGGTQPDAWEAVSPNEPVRSERALQMPTWRWVDGGAQTVLLYCSDSLFAPTVLHFTCPVRKFSEELTDGMGYASTRRDRAELRSQLVRQR